MTNSHTVRTDEVGNGLPPFPKLILLDTNVIQNLQVFGEYMFDNYLAEDMETKLVKLGARVTADIHALADLMALGRRQGWPLSISTRNLDELDQIRNPAKRFTLIQWGEELYQYSSNYSGERLERRREDVPVQPPFTTAERDFISTKLHMLPQESDRQLIIDALESECDIFLTMDYKTIWRFREEVAPLGLTVMRPVELLEYIGPWIGLLR